MGLSGLEIKSQLRESGLVVTRLSAARVAGLVDGFPTSPAYAGLAAALRRLIVDGRLPRIAQLPSERELAAVLGLSRTTVTRAYAELQSSGHASGQRGSGTYTRLPGRAHPGLDRALTPDPGKGVVVDLNCAAPGAAQGLATAYEQALTELPQYFGSHGYFPFGLPPLREAIAAAFVAQGLPTDPDQIMITPGALAGAAVAAQALTRPGQRVLIENPVYPNAAQAFSSRATRLVPVDVSSTGWDFDAVESIVRQSAPTLAYTIPDFHNPTGTLMPEGDRERFARLLTRARCVAVIDESHRLLGLDVAVMPAPLASHVEGMGGTAVTVGSLSKAYWGGLRIGWIRAPRRLVDPLMEARLTLDLGVPVLEQLVAVRLLADGGPVSDQTDSLRRQRAALVGALRARLPQWRFTLPPGGLALWVELPEARSLDVVAAAMARGVTITPGPSFAVGGGLTTFVRIPYTRPVPELLHAVAVLAVAWEDSARTTRPVTPRHTVA